MKLVDEKGKLFGILNIIDLLVILLLIVAVALIGWKVLKKDGASNANRTILTYTVEVKGVDQEVYEGIKAYVPGESGIGDQLMADGSMVDALRMRSSLNCSNSRIETASFFPFPRAACSQRK